VSGETGRERLQKLAWLLENLPAERPNLVEPVSAFSMRDWHCGARACAIGHAALHPWFRKRGLTLIVTEEGVDCPAAYGKADQMLVARFFGLDIYEYGSLFIYSDKRTAKGVAKAIRNHLKAMR
jgi:hypothetical protein